MAIFQWTARQHAVDVPAVDGEHQELFRLCDDLYGALKGKAPARKAQRIFLELAGHLAEHLAHEEREMRTDRYELYAWHRRQHETARGKVATLEQRIRKGDREAALELLEFLHHWLNDHIRLADRMLGAHIRNDRRARAARA